MLLLCHVKLHQKLLEAQEKVVGYLTGREQVYPKFWLKLVHVSLSH